MKAILGMTKVGVAQLENGSYVGYDKDNYRYIATDDLSKAHPIMGDLELNLERIMHAFSKQVCRRTRASLIIKDYVYMNDLSKSCFLETMPIQARQALLAPAYAYEYERG